MRNEFLMPVKHGIQLNFDFLAISFITGNMVFQSIDIRKDPHIRPCFLSTAGKLASLEDFLMQKDKLMGQMESLKEQLEQQRQEHQTVIYNLEKKAVLDNYRSV